MIQFQAQTHKDDSNEEAHLSSIQEINLYCMYWHAATGIDKAVEEAPIKKELSEIQLNDRPSYQLPQVQVHFMRSYT